jgi:hypothetical protein
VKDVVLTYHAKERAEERGVTLEEILEVLKTGQGFPAKKGRRQKEKIFRFEQEWLGEFYEQKKVRVVYVEESDKIVIVTVYAFYGKWR